MILLNNKIDDFIIQPEGKGVLVVSCWLLVVWFIDLVLCSQFVQIHRNIGVYV